jgi:hypothetical protein
MCGSLFRTFSVVKLLGEEEQMSKRRQKNQSRRPIVFIGAGVLFMIAAVLIWMLYRPDQSEQAANTPQPAVNSGQIERLSLSDAKSAYDQESAVFLDVRTRAEYDESHIPGAISIPLDELPDRVGELNPNDWIITYCT